MIFNKKICCCFNLLKRAKMLQMDDVQMDLSVSFSKLKIKYQFLRYSIKTCRFLKSRCKSTLTVHLMVLKNLLLFDLQNVANGRRSLISIWYWINSIIKFRSNWILMASIWWLNCSHEIRNGYWIKVYGTPPNCDISYGAGCSFVTIKRPFNTPSNTPWFA